MSMPGLPPENSTTEDVVPAGGAVVLLIDESDAMREPIAGGTKSKAESVATAVNSLLSPEKPTGAFRRIRRSSKRMTRLS